MKTRILHPDPQGIAAAAALLGQGALVAMPTETVYGLAGDARDPRAVAAIYEAKGRPVFNPLIVHLPDLAAAERIALFDDQALALARAFWPGALTLVLPLRPEAGIAGLVTAGLDTVAIRVPALAAARDLLRAFGGPLAAPSANPSGRISPTAAAHVADPETGLGGRIAAVLDAGPCPVGVESTILGWVDGAPALLRPGGIAAEAIEAVLGRPLSHPAPNPEAPNAPGQLTSHYAPRAQVRLDAVAARPGELLIGFGPVAGEMSLSEAGDPAEAAARLFELLHRADADGRPIAVAPVPETGLGAAVNDRLRRAAAPR
ncbi:L-threonylcarbamoyladenylate synthase [Paracoccus aminovorans]|uniref:Threonylcarbamoyl-AMP synthase n=1 Tax=Paracoccus aminovorans TaxID=34004 RepID=A0A1I2XQQ0_9RHOB|nr:L-threonylcarbamoyladenylate synthase [Paracoccus aminovorans]CQR87295.1 translation factor Sua5 [Paracoccus aminovorans]SFH15790.1 L-threonylcarbamoyladenylate synthase [Paracoccus aminovorans]